MERNDGKTAGWSCHLMGYDHNAAAIGETLEIPPGRYVRRRWRQRLRAMGWRPSTIRHQAAYARYVRRSGAEWPGVYFSGTARSQMEYTRIDRIMVPAESAPNATLTFGVV